MHVRAPAARSMLHGGQLFSPQIAGERRCSHLRLHRALRHDVAFRQIRNASRFDPDLAKLPGWNCDLAAKVEARGASRSAGREWHAVLVEGAVHILYQPPQVRSETGSENDRIEFFGDTVC